MKKMNVIFTALSILIGTAFSTHPNMQDINISLYEAASKGAVSAVEELIKAGADVNSKTADGMAPLHVAALMGHRNIIKQLLKMGAEPNLQDDKNKWTALHYAIAKGHGHLLGCLIEGGADTLIHDEEKKTPLDLIGKNDKKMINLLVAAIALHKSNQLEWIIEEYILRNRSLLGRIKVIWDDFSWISVNYSPYSWLRFFLGCS